MSLRLPAIVCAARPHGEAGVIARLLTEAHGLTAAYVAGGRGRQLRPVLIPGNLVEAELKARAGSAMPSARLELTASRGPWLSEPLPAAAIVWATTLTAATLPERHAYPPLFAGLSALLEAICAAPSARGWAPALLGYEGLLLRELGYGDAAHFATDWRGLLGDGAPDWPRFLAAFDRMGLLLARYPLAERRGDAMAARNLLRERLARMVAP
jgi:DNA repair protein RecO (recombination protein O)